LLILAGALSVALTPACTPVPASREINGGEHHSHVRRARRMIAAKRPVWRPLLEGPIAKEATEAAEGVAAEIGRSRRHRRGTRSRSEPALASGTAGSAVLYAYLGQAGLGRRYESASRRVLKQAGDALGSVTMAPSLYGG